MVTLDSLFTEFVREKTYLQNVTPKTCEWCATAWKAFTRYRNAAPPRTSVSPLITRADLQGFVIHLRERGLKPVSCNTWVRVLNTFCRWLHQNGHIPEAIRLAPQRLEKRMVPVHGDVALRTLLRFKPKTFDRWRAHAVACTILDTGCRIEELLTARTGDFDFDNLLLIVVGKGGSSGRCRSPSSCENCCSDSVR
jgi:integrase